MCISELNIYQSCIKSVIVTIRGTLSLEDCISDALAEPISMQAAG